MERGRDGSGGGRPCDRPPPGRYDVLFMPPSFPFGGMENPCLTFVTPCLLAGDRSLADVIIHEISHSWFGNLVTNAHWGEFWLNEGFTMFAQRRISTILFGERPVASPGALGIQVGVKGGGGRAQRPWDAAVEANSRQSYLPTSLPIINQRGRGQRQSQKVYVAWGVPLVAQWKQSD